MYRIFRKGESEKFSGGDIFKEFRSPNPNNEPTDEILKVEDNPVNQQEMELENAFKESMKMADEIVEKAKIEAEAIKRETYEKAWKNGYDIGIDEGRKQGEEGAYREAMAEYNSELVAKIQSVEDAISQYVSDMEIEKEKILEKYIDDLRDISIAIGEKIVKTSLKSSEDVVKRMILAATEKLKKTAWAKIYIAGIKDGETIRGDKGFLHSLSKLSDNVKIVVLDDEEPGTCLIELPNEIIDVSFQSQLENIREILHNARS